MHFPFFPPTQESIGFLDHVFVYLNFFLMKPTYGCMIVLLIVLSFTFVVHSCFEVLAASHLSKMLESESINLFFQEELQGFHEKGGGAFLVDFLLQGCIDQDPQALLLKSIIPLCHKPLLPKPVTEHNRNIRQADFWETQTPPMTHFGFRTPRLPPPKPCEAFLRIQQQSRVLLPNLLPALVTWHLACFVHISQLSYIHT